MARLFFVFLVCQLLVQRSVSSSIGQDRQRQEERQERRLEDTARHFNAGFVEYKSKVIEDQLGDDEEIDEYVVIEAADSNNSDNQNSEHNPYEEVDDHYDEDDDGDDYVRPTKGDLGHRGLVPQLWPNYTGPALPPAESVSCNEARLKCAYRAGCGLALQNYVLGCSDLAKGNSKTCNTHCRHSLIALISTPEGQRLMKCNCSGDAQCERSKESVAPCHAEVSYATQPDTVVSCSAAQWICAADPQCSTALDYYNRFCGAMFRGKRCTKRCLNSINILKRQVAAAKLETCFCDGTEEFDCLAVKSNMERLCYGFNDAGDQDEDNAIEIDGDKKSAAAHSSSLKVRFQRFLLILSVIVSVLAELVVGSVTALFQMKNDAEDAST